LAQTILLIDQEYYTSDLIKTYLRADGWTVDHTLEPSEALKFIAENKRYNVIITDLVLPSITGFDLYRKIRQYDDQVKFMFLLNIMSSEVLRLMGSLDRNDIIKKDPLSINEVIWKVRATFMNSH
jgi:DNA-binding response OmpR family regulator